MTFDEIEVGYTYGQANRQNALPKDTEISQ